MSFEKIIRRLKQSEALASVLFLERLDAVRMALAWPRVDVALYEAEDKPPSLEAPEPEQIKWIWRQAEYDIKEWARIADVALPEARAIAGSLIANGLVYPDGTVHDAAMKYARTVVAKMMRKAVVK